MKSAFVLFLTFITSSAFAAESITLDSTTLTLEQRQIPFFAELLLKRGPRTPSEVTLIVNRKEKEVCAREENQTVYGASPTCGSYSVPNCRLEKSNCSMEMMCVMYGPMGCHREEMRETHCDYRQECTEETQYLSCAHTKSVCVETRKVAQQPLVYKMRFDLKPSTARRTHFLKLGYRNGGVLNLRSKSFKVTVENDNTWIIRR